MSLNSRPVSIGYDEIIVTNLFYVVLFFVYYLKLFGAGSTAILTSDNMRTSDSRFNTSVRRFDNDPT